MATPFDKKLRALRQLGLSVRVFIPAVAALVAAGFGDSQARLAHLQKTDGLSCPSRETEVAFIEHLQ
jgi:hypothetical protein